MTLSEAARPVLLVGRLITVAASVLAFGLMAWRAYDLLHYAFLFEHPKWGDVGIYPFVTGLRIIVAVWVAWSVFRLGGDTLLHVQLMAFGGSFILLYGWHLLLIGMDDGFLYWVVAGDFLYLAGALAVGCDLFLEKVGPRPGTNQT